MTVTRTPAPDLGADYYRYLDDATVPPTCVTVGYEPTPTPAMVNAQTIFGRAAAALTANATYLNVASPSNAQVAAQVKALTRQVDGLIRIALTQYDTTADS